MRFTLFRRTIYNIQHTLYIPRAAAAGQSLLELLIGIAVAGGILTAIAGMVFVSLNGASIARERSVAQTLLNDMYASLQSIAQSGWHSLWVSSGAVAYWPLDDGAGAAGTNNIAIDEAGGNNATIDLGSTGNTSLATAWQANAACKGGQCLSFDGTDDKATTQLNYTFTSAMTGTAWVKFNNVANQQFILALGSSTNEFSLQMQGAGNSAKFRIRVDAGAGADITDSTTQAQTGQWYFVAWTYDGTSTKLFINGTEETNVVQGTGTGNMTALADPTYLGARADGYDLNGYLDDVRLYSRALSGTEIASLAAGVDALHPVNTSGSWSMAEGKESITSGTATFTRYLTLGSVQRNGSGVIVSSGGTSDPFTKNATLVVTWKGFTVSEQTYLVRSASNQAFVQADWSGGPGQTGPVFAASNLFDTASSTVTYSTANQISATSTGYLTSSIFDSQIAAGVGISGIVWQGTLGAGTVKFQIAASNFSAGPWNYIGADGTTSSYFPLGGTSQPDTTIPFKQESLYNQRYFRYRVYVSNASTTSIAVDYSQ